MGQRRPNHAYRPHPHIMGDATCVLFGCPTRRGPVLWQDRHIQNVLIYLPRQRPEAHPSRSILVVVIAVVVAIIVVDIVVHIVVL
jgi:hypothetical protein